MASPSLFDHRTNNNENKSHEFRTTSLSLFAAAWRLSLLGRNALNLLEDAAGNVPCIEAGLWWYWSIL